MSLKQNIIYLYFKGKHLITSKSQYQYNHGQYLYFADLNLPQAFEVHFSNKDRGESKTQIGSDRLVEIPDEYFWNGALQIYAWVYLHDGTDDGETIYEVRIPLIKRAKPTDEEPLPVQQSAIDKAIAELNNAVDITNENADKTNADKTQVATIKEEVVTLKEEIDSTASVVNQDAQTAKTAAERSERSAQNSAEFENDAHNYADEAKGYAQNALESKNTASQKAQVATDASAEAKDYRDEAETFKNEAKQAKQNIVDYRNETKGYRDEALIAKNDAQDSANAAQRTSEQMTQAGAEIIENVRDLGSRYATQAETAANNAEISAESASSSAQASAQSVSQAEQIKADVEELVDDAQGYATASANSASASAQSATMASESANSASASANMASGKASEASGYAQTASQKATETSGYANTSSQKASESANSASLALGYKNDALQAKTGAETAQGLAESARDSAISAKNDAEDARDEAQSIVDGISGKVEQIDSNTERIESLEDDRYKPYPTDTASGAIASFSDGADNIPLESLIVNIDPVQDLHGYDSPWVGGSNSNKWDEQWELGRFDTTTGNNIENTTQIRAKNLTPVIPNTTYYISSPEILWFLFYDVDKNVISEGLPESQSSGNARAFGGTASTRLRMTTPVNCYYVRIYCQTSYGTTYNNDIAINYPDTITTYSPYKNICPINGWTGMNVVQTGFNQWDEEWELGDYHVSVGHGEKRNQSGRIRCKNFIPVVPNETYYCITPDAGNTIGLFYDENKTYGSGSDRYVLISNRTFVIPEWAHYMTFYLVATSYNNDISINYPSTDHDYHSYTGQVIPISWQTEAGTVYGGRLDVLSGVMRVKMAMADLGTLNWGLASNQFYANLVGAKLGEYSIKPKALCSVYPTLSWAAFLTSGTDKAFAINTGQSRVNVKDSTYTDATVFKTAMSGAQLCYELATPIEIQLTPHEVNSLFGQNNIWADTGDSSVEYRADTRLYIEKLTQPEEDDMIADSAITSGQFFMIGNALYRALANIASGATITVGTNAQRVSLSDALNLVNA